MSERKCNHWRGGGVRPAQYQTNHNTLIYWSFFVAHITYRDPSTQNGHINVTMYNVYNHLLQDNDTTPYVSAIFCAPRMRIPTTLTVM